MLFRQHHLEGIRTGRISLAFRKWKKPAVKKGSLIKTAIGQVEICDISVSSINAISDQDAIDAGFESALVIGAILDEIKEGDVYRISLRYHSPDPRVALRDRVDVSEQEFLDLRKKLERLDRHSKTGKWTMETLLVIRDNPRLKAKYLAEKFGQEKDAFKLNVRKLKNLGLTISHEVGYSLSPLGQQFLERDSRVV